jgi:hypothetical protein
MFKKMKNMALRAMISRQLKGMPKDMQDKILDAVENNPEFFEKMAKEIKERVDKGEDKMMASQAVAMKYQQDLMKIMMGGNK